MKQLLLIFCGILLISCNIQQAKKHEMAQKALKEKPYIINANISIFGNNEIPADDWTVPASGFIQVEDSLGNFLIIPREKINFIYHRNE